MAPKTATKFAPARRETAPTWRSPEQSLTPGHPRRDVHTQPAGDSAVFNAQCPIDAQRVDGADTPGHSAGDTQKRLAGGSSLSTASDLASPKPAAPLPATDDQYPCETQVRAVVGGDPLPPALLLPSPKGQAPGDHLADDQVGDDSQKHIVVGPPAIRDPTSNRESPGDPVYDALRADAEALDGIEAVRIATENRLRTMLPGSPEAARTAILMVGLKDLEKQAVRNLEKTLKGMPLGAWIQSTPGIGLKQGARLLAAIGDPATRANPAKLWRYAGLDPVDGKARERRKGEFAGWNPDAKMRAFLVAESCLKAKARSPYGPLYDHERAKHAGAIHAHECRRCGPKGRPALPGSALSDGHGHARALRRVAKEVLKDMWRVSRADS
jgi:hypothetical protein